MCVCANFRIKAKNIPRLVNGETYYEDNQMDPFIQRVIIPDLPSNYVVEMEFTEKEFNTWDTFCRNITQFINGNRLANKIKSTVHKFL